LRRLASTRAKLKESLAEGEEAELLAERRNLCIDENGFLRIRNPPEVRSFVVSSTADPELAAASTHFLTAAREERGEAPFGLVSVMSFSVGDVVAFDVQDKQRFARLKRQLLILRTDIICLQGLYTSNKGGSEECFGSSLAATLSEEGYGFVCASGMRSEGNAIFWDRSRLEVLSTTEHGSALGVDLRPFADPTCEICVACLRPEVPTPHSQTLSGLCSSDYATKHRRLIVCSDLAALGGADGASVIEEFSELHSAMREVLVGEVMMPMAAPTKTTGARCPASGLNTLHSPDGMHFKGLAPVLALSGHTEGYLATMPSEEVVQQFPALRLPLVAAFDWTNSLVESNLGSHDQDRVRL